MPVLLIIVMGVHLALSHGNWAFLWVIGCSFTNRPVGDWVLQYIIIIMRFILLTFGMLVKFIIRYGYQMNNIGLIDMSCQDMV